MWQDRDIAAEYSLALDAGKYCQKSSQVLFISVDTHEGVMILSASLTEGRRNMTVQPGQPENTQVQTLCDPFLSLKEGKQVTA